MERDEVLRLAREAGMAGLATTVICEIDELQHFAALVAAAERIKNQAEVQRLTTLANTAEKWRGIAMSRDGDGRTVQEVQAEAVAAEREAIAVWYAIDGWLLDEGAVPDAIRARVSA